MAVAFIDPVAQTFFVDAEKYPKGVFVHSVDLVFKKRDETTWLPFTIQLRPTVNGYPHASLIHSGAALGEVSVNSELIKTVSGVEPDLPDIRNPDHYTRFKFVAPVFLLPGEHALILFSGSDDYEVYVATIGGERLDGSDRQVDKQLYTGSFFKSQNGSTYTAYQDIDLMFRLNVCDFYPESSQIIFENRPLRSNSEYDLIKISSQELTFKDTNSQYFYKVMDSATSILDANFTNILLGQDIELDTRKIIYNNATKSFIVRAEISTTDNTVSTVIDTTRINSVIVKNLINDCPLLNENFAVTNSGTGYTANAAVTITASHGSGGAVVAVANTISQKIERIEVTSPGSGYIGDISISIDDPSVPAGNTTAVGVVESETNARGGPAIARYITRKVVLADNFDSNMIRVYLTAYQPGETNIEVYYKVLANEDPTNFDDRPYVRMKNVQQGNESLPNILKSKVKDEFLEYLFIPTTSEITYTSGGTTYTNFKTFAIKIVMRSSNPAVVPIIRDLRAIALAP